MQHAYNYDSFIYIYIYNYDSCEPMDGKIKHI